MSRIHMTDRLHAITRIAIETVYPKRCAGCRRRGVWVCGTCEAAVARFRPPWCVGCGVPTDRFRCACHDRPPTLSAVRSVGPYDGWLRDAVLLFKYQDEWSRVEHFAPALIDALVDVEAFDALVAVPLHPKRLRERGYNQSEVLANAVGRRLGKPCLRAIERVRATPHQARLGAAERPANVAGAFAPRRDVAVEGLSVVLVDDVVTTGSTLAECAAVLRTAGAREVRALTIARELG